MKSTSDMARVSYWCQLSPGGVSQTHDEGRVSERLTASLLSLKRDHFPSSLLAVDPVGDIGDHCGVHVLSWL